MTTSKRTANRAKGAKSTKTATNTNHTDTGPSSGKKATKAPNARQKRPAKTQSESKRATKPRTKPGAAKSSKPTKSSLVLKLLSRRNGATLSDLMAATGWQAHSVRGFLSGTVRKRLKLPLIAQVTNDERRYRIDTGKSSKEAS